MKVNYVFARLRISLKRMVEYKGNLYSSLLIEPIWFICLIVPLIVFLNFGIIEGWTYKELILFILFVSLIDIINGLAVYGNYLQHSINSGKINSYLMRPFSAFFQHVSHFSETALIIALIDGIAIISCMILFHMQWTYFWLVIIIVISAGILKLVYVQFIHSISFFAFGIEDVLLYADSNVGYFSESYTTKVFEKSIIYFVSFVLSAFYVYKLIIPLIQGTFPDGFWFLFIGIFILIGVFFSATLIMWHYGLKKYEGYN